MLFVCTDYNNNFVQFLFHCQSVRLIPFLHLVVWFFYFNWTALLSGTLKTYQRAACDEETMTLKCPPGTTIIVEHAQYGRTGMYGISKCNSSVPPMIAGDRPTNHTCIWPQSVQVCANEILSFRTGKCQAAQCMRFSSLLKIIVAWIYRSI